MIYFLAFSLAILLTAALVRPVKRLAIKWQIIDSPAPGRKIHKLPTPLMGGVAVFLGFFGILFLFGDQLLSGGLSWRHWLGFLAGGLALIIGGVLDDKYNLRPSQQIIWPLLAIIFVVLGGVNIEKITNPFGGYIYLSVLASGLLIGLWLLGMMYTTKLLDGVDGLVTGVTAIGGLIIFLFTLTTKYYQPDIALAAAVLTGAALGFLIFNFNPAKIFLGEGGSLLFGYILGVLAIISGGKIAIALLVMGVPILDVLWTIMRRLAKHKNPFKFADRQHLHHRLLDLGFSQKKTVLVFYFLAFSFGLSGLFLQSAGKLLALSLLVFFMLLVVASFHFLDRKTRLPKLLLHICCAPCGGYVASQILSKNYQVTLYFYNPNIDTLEEFEKRLAGVRLVAEKFKLPLIVEPYNHDYWLSKVRGLEKELEKGSRCLLCYGDRLEKTALLARAKGYEYFGTSLTASPYKDTATILNLGREIAGRCQVKLLEVDFKALDYYQKSLEFVKSLNIYRQKYCGCEFAKRSFK